MNKLKLNPNNIKYYSEEFIKGFECGVERQFNADKEQKMGRWIEHFDESGKWYECDQCHTDWGGSVNYCPNCGADMRKEK